jgi:hypothetical protein
VGQPNDFIFGTRVALIISAALLVRSAAIAISGAVRR